MRKYGYWGTNLKLFAFSDLMRLNINIYTSLNQEDPEFKIDHPQNAGLLIDNHIPHPGRDNMKIQFFRFFFNIYISLPSKILITKV